MLIRDNHGKGLAVVRLHLRNVHIHIRVAHRDILRAHLLIASLALVQGKHILVYGSKLHIHMSFGIMKRCCIVILILLARRSNKSKVCQSQMVVFYEIFRVLELHAYPARLKDSRLVVGSRHRHDQLSQRLGGNQEHTILCIVWLQFQLLQISQSLIGSDVLLLSLALHLLDLRLTILLRYTSLILAHGFVGILLLPFVDGTFYEIPGKA